MKFFAYFIVLVVFFFVLLAIYDYQQMKRKKEEFDDTLMIKKLLEPGKVIYFQGHQMPIMNPVNPPTFDNEPGDKPPVKCDTSDPNIPEALNVFAYNKCEPQCCLESAYSCNGGCVCVENSQYELIAKRGSCSNVRRDEF